MNCSKCGSSEFVKAGFVIRRQRFKCKNCGTFYSVDQKTTGMSKDTKQLAFQMHVEGLGYNSIARIIGVSHVAVIKWIKSVDSNYKPESKNEKTVIINSISNDRTEKRTVGSKLFELYKTLSLNEKKRVADYIESPFFNANEDIIKLNQYIYSTCFAKKEADLEFKKIQWLFEGASDQKVKEVASLLL
ncbi:MAG: IS1 family transposase, partial [Bacteroidia bacterium]|nr:IS1 family transposase [Bacteroidia bacterium]